MAAATNSSALLRWMTKELVEAWTGCDNGEGSPEGAVEDGVYEIMTKLLTLAGLDADEFELACLREYVVDTDNYNVVNELWETIEDGEEVLPTCLELADWIRCMRACKPEEDVWPDGLEDLRLAFTRMADEAEDGQRGLACEAELKQLVASEFLRHRPPTPNPSTLLNQ